MTIRARISLYSHGRSRGQVMVLGCMTLLLIALMLMVSFNLTNAIHERIRIQAHADAMAYSLATLEARTFNVIAHMNRAIAATLVAQMTLHAWMTLVTVDVAILAAAALAALLTAAAEVVMGCIPPRLHRCLAAINAVIVMLKFWNLHRKYLEKMDGLESQFNKGVKGLTEILESLYKRQKSILRRMFAALSGKVGTISKLREINAPKSEPLNALVLLTLKEFKCAQEGGIEKDADCDDRPKAKASVRSAIMQNVANASRPLALTTTGLQPFSMMNHKDFRGFHDLPAVRDILTDGSLKVLWFGQARVGEGLQVTLDNPKTAKAENVGAGTIVLGGILLKIQKDSKIHMPMIFTSQVYSGKRENDHGGIPIINSHGTEHNKFTGVQMKDPCEKTCFVNFRSIDDAEKDFGMPNVYAGVKQNLRLFQSKTGSFEEDAPWEITDTGEVSMEVAEDQAMKLKLVARNDGIAVAKAKVYFHQLQRWNVAPNFFDPFWRAKLHFFSKAELKKVLALAGDTNGVIYTSLGAPVEGEE